MARKGSTQPILHAFAVAAGLCVLPLTAFPAAAQSPPAPAVTVAKPVVKKIHEVDDFTGRFDAIDQVDVRARVGGYLDTVHFVDGVLVKAGDLLFTIDQRPYRTALAQAEADLNSARARVDFDQTDLERAESLRKSGNIPEQGYDLRRQSLLTARADLDRATAVLDRAKLDMEFTEIRAPFAGRISRHLVSPGNLVVANETLLANIVALDPIYFYFDIDERSYLSYLGSGLNGTRPGAAAADVFVTLTNETEGKRAGTIDFVDNRVDQASGTIRGRAVFPNKDLSLTPGLFGRIRIPGSTVYDGVLLPEEAVGSDQDRRVVFVVGPDNKVETRPVRLGPRIDGYRVIREGLSGNETVVINGLMRVRPGMVVEPKPKTLPPSREVAGG